MTGKARSEPPDFDPRFPLPAPVAMPGCKPCSSYVASIKAARSSGDESVVTDCRVMMQRHIDAGHT